MNKKQLRYIVALMSGATLGLIILQFYWINEAFEFNAVRFKSEVIAAAENVANTLERREVHRAMVSYRELTGKHNSLLMQIFKQMNAPKLTESFLLWNQIDEPTRQYVPEFSGSSFNHPYSVGSHLRNGSTIEREWNRNSVRIGDSSLYIQQIHQQKLFESIEELETVWRIIASRRNFGRPLNERINVPLLDSLLAHEFKAKNINLPYWFGVLVKDTVRNYRLTHTNVEQNETAKVLLLQKGISVRLFPNDDLSPAAFLYVYFPDNRSAIFKQMIAVLVSSLIFNVIIIVCFAFAISTIIRQKKISEVTRDFINNMTHEFKTPVSTISLACQALQDPDMRSNPRILDRYLNIIKEENNRLGHQVEKVLQIASLEKGDFKLKIEEVDVHQLLRKAGENMKLSIDSKGGQLVMHLEASQTKIQADKVHLTNIFYNLLDNATKYSSKEPHVTVTTEDGRGGIIVSIADKGVGISKDVINRIFDKFYRVPTGNIHNVKGFGLGLSYVKMMVDAHHGQISVQSRLGEGSTFTIFLPYQYEPQQNFIG